MALGTTTYNRIDENIRNTWLLMISFALFIISMLWVFSQAYGIDSVGFLGIGGIALMAIGAIQFIAYYFSDQIVLNISKAKRVNDRENYELISLVDGLCIGMGIPKPDIYTIDDSATNAFATGRDPEHSAIVFTTGILQKLNRQELEGVIAHELSHIKNRDTLYTTVVVILVGLIALLSDIFTRSLFYGRGDRNKGGSLFLLLGLAFALLSPLIAQLIKFAVSRQREYLADASAALVTRYPDGLASALEKISSDTEPLEVANKATAHLFIVNPLKNWHGSLNNMFSTHPPVEERIKRLKQM